MVGLVEDRCVGWAMVIISGEDYILVLLWWNVFCIIWFNNCWGMRSIWRDKRAKEATIRKRTECDESILMIKR